MARRTSAAHDAAQREYEQAPSDAKPSARQLAARHDLAESTLHRAAWYHGTGNEQQRAEVAQQKATKARRKTK